MGAIAQLRGTNLEDGYVARATGQTLPDQTPVQVWVRSAYTGSVVTDLGETTEWMRKQVSAARLPQRARATVEGICRMNDVELDRGTLSVRLPPRADVNEAVDRLARVCARIARLKID